ncbi:acyl-CoA thioester hydrolase/BAAT C-terminal domain-containing protein [Alteriqipengyuania sp. 357]
MRLGKKIGCGCGGLVLLLVLAAIAIWTWKPWASMVPLEMVEPEAARGQRVDTGDVLGNYYPAKGVENGPGILLIGGSEGGLGSDMTRLALALQADGFSVLQQSYWRAPDQPERLEGVPLETFQRGLAWLRARPEVDPARTAMMGWSRGSEATQLIAIRDPRLKAIVLGMPGNAVWPGFTWEEPWKQLGSPWTWRGEDLPYLDTSGVQMFGADREQVAQDLLALQDAQPDAVIAVEEIGAPILMICGEADNVWASCPMARKIEKRAGTNGKEDVTLLAYAGAGHYGYGAPVSEDDPDYANLSRLGGSKDGTAQALREGYREIVAFLKDELGGEGEEP